MSKAAFNYLLEFSVVEKLRREEYLAKLLKRKNADQQKNVKLLKIIYRLIDSDSINDWDSDEVCKELEINNVELDTLKSRLLNDFREFVFKWPEFEEELKQNFKGDDIQFELLRIRKMHRIGMRREIRTLLYNLLKLIDKDPKSLIQNYGITDAQIYQYKVEINEAFLNYYYVNKNYPQFISFYNEFEKLYKMMKKYKLTEKEEALINVRLYLIRAYKHIFKEINDKSYKSALNNLYAANELMKEYSIDLYKYGIVFLIMLIEFRLGNYEKLKELGLYVLDIGEKEGKKEEVCLANAYLIMLQFNEDKERSREIESELKRYYLICKEMQPYSNYSFSMIKYYVHILTYNENFEETDLVMKDALANAVLSGNKSFIFLTYFQIENDKHLREILKFNNKAGEIPELLPINKTALDNFEKVLINLIFNSKDNFSNNVLCDVYLSYLYVIYLREEETDFSRAETIISKLNRMVKTRNIAIDNNLFDALLLCYVMQEDFEIMKTEDFLKKHSFSFKKLCDQVTGTKTNTIYKNSESYSVLYTLAKRLNSSDIWGLMNKYDWSS